MEIVKQNAVANALKKASADVLVEPIFETEISGGRISVIVTGWSANYKKFRSINVEDAQLLQVGVVQKVKVYEVSKEQQKRGRRESL